MLRLHLGCGARHLDGWVNVDLPGGGAYGKAPDLEHDLTEPLPYADGTVDEVFSSHVFEHFDRWAADDILADWIRVLKPGGRIALEMPCLDKVLGYIFGQVSKGEPVAVNMSMWALYGDPGHKDRGMTHRWCYGVSEISSMFAANGIEAKLKEPVTHVKARDMRVEGVKRGD